MPKKNKYGLELKNLNKEDKSVDLYIYGEIVDEKFWDDEVSPREIADILSDIDKFSTINMYVNSPGGSVFAGIAIYNILNRFDGKIIAHIDAIAASSGTYPVMAADEIVMYANTMLFIHEPTVLAYGNSADFEKIIDQLKSAKDIIVSMYDARFNIDKEEISKLMENETYINAEMALELGIITEIAGLKDIEVVENKNKKIINGVEFNIDNYKNFPKNFGEKKEKVVEPVEPKVPEIQQSIKIDYSNYENDIKLTELLINSKESV